MDDRETILRKAAIVVEDYAKELSASGDNFQSDTWLIIAIDIRELANRISKESNSHAVPLFSDRKENWPGIAE